MNLKNWFENLPERERHIVLASSILVLILLIYALIWSPLSSAVTDRKQQVTSQKNLLGYLKNAAARIQELKAAGVDIQRTDNADLLTLAEQTLSSHQLSTFLKEVQQPQQNEIVLNFEKVPFDQLMQWVETLSTVHAVGIKQVSADRLAVTGTANVQMTLMSGSSASTTP